MAEPSLQLPDSVTQENVLEWLPRGIAGLDSGDLLVDLGRLEEIDSSTISMLLEWAREARRRGRRVRYLNIPENLSSLATIYGVSELIEHL